MFKVSLLTYVIPLLLLSINLAADDANDQSTQQAHEVLQGLNQQINRIKNDIKLRSNVVLAALPMLTIPGAALYDHQKTRPLGTVILIVGVLGCCNSFIKLPIQQNELDTLEKQKAELLQKLKEAPVQ